LVPQKGCDRPASPAGESFSPESEKRIVTDGGRQCEPTKLGYRVLAVLAGEARTTGALVSELRAHPAVDVSEQAVRRTLRALRTCDLARQGDTGRWVITAEGRALERAERQWRRDHAATHTERVRGVQRTGGSDEPVTFLDAASEFAAEAVAEAESGAEREFEGGGE
jgi:hypothetical protein